MNPIKIKACKSGRTSRKLFSVIIAVLMPVLLYPQTTPDMQIERLTDPMVPGRLDTVRFINYIQDTLCRGGGKLSDPKFIGNPQAVGVFSSGQDVGFSDGIIISNGNVMTSIADFMGRKTGADAFPDSDSLGPYFKPGGGGIPPAYYLQDNDMDWMAGLISGPPIRPDTAVDPTIITFKFKPFYSTIWMRYVFASEEYEYQQDPLSPPVPPPIDVDLTNRTNGSDFMAIFFRKFPSEGPTPNNIASVVHEPPGGGWVPVSVEYLNDSIQWGYYVANYDNAKSFIFDGTSVPMEIRPYPLSKSEIVPCQTYWVKIGVADYPNGMVLQGYNLSHQINSAVFLEAYSLMSGYGKEWTVTGGVDNPDFTSDTSLVEGGCSNMVITVKFNVKPESWDTTHILMKIGNADYTDFTITPPLEQDSVIVIPPTSVDSVTLEYTLTITAVDDGIPEGTGGIDKWFIRYQMDPCDRPTLPDTLGQANAGYSGLIKVNVRDYNHFVNTTKYLGPDLPPPASQYHCGGNISFGIGDILQGGIPPYYYVWNDDSHIGFDSLFTTTINDSPDWATCTIRDNCSDKPGYASGLDSVIIYSKLTVEAFPSTFQLCQNGHTIIKVRNTNVGRDFTTKWYFQGNLVGSDSVYDVTWAEYGQYAPANIDFICVVSDYCGNTASDTVQASFFPVVAIQGVPLICIGDTIHLTCTPANAYQWYYDSYPGTPIPGATFPDLFYTPTTPGNHTICVSIINECGEQADTCFTFFVSQLICEMVLNNSPTDFTVCPNVLFTLKELNGYDGWEWSWNDNGPHTATGQTITLSMTVAGDHTVQVTAYNINGCYNTITRTVTVHPYSAVQAFKDPPSVCIGNPAQLSATTGPVTISNYVWSANPPDPSLTGQQNSATPTVFPHVTTTYQCKIQDNNGCWDSTTVTVDVRERLAVDIFANPDSICTDKPVQLGFTIIVPPMPSATYNWTFDDGVPASSNAIQPPQVVWSNPGIKDIYLSITESGCDSTFHFQYVVNPDPLAGFTTSNNTGCQPVDASFTNISSNLENPTYLWEFGDGATSTLESPGHTYPDAGTYDVTLTVTNSTGCVNVFTLNGAVEVYEVPVAKFRAEPQAATIDNPTINFTEEINITYDSIFWNFGDSTYMIRRSDSPSYLRGAGNLLRRDVHRN